MQRSALAASAPPVCGPSAHGLHRPASNTASRRRPWLRRRPRRAPRSQISSKRRNVLRRIEAAVPGICAALECPTNLRINPAKTRHASKIGARRVTGLTLGSDGRVYLGRGTKRTIRALIFLFDTLSEEQKASLRGWIAYAKGVGWASGHFIAVVSLFNTMTYGLKLCAADPGEFKESRHFFDPLERTISEAGLATDAWAGPKSCNQAIYAGRSSPPSSRPGRM